MLPLWKRILRWIVKAVATIAFLVFFFDNRLSGTAGTVLLCSIIVLFLCLFVWLIFGLSGAEDSGYWPNKPR
jgi:lipopolysaccharide export LptBFGC system permease protein LptF